MYATTAAGSGIAAGTALLGGTGLAGSTSVLPLAGHVGLAGSTSVLPVVGQLGGTGVANSAAVLPVAAHPSGFLGSALAFTGPAIPYVQMLMLALLAVSLGLLIIHASRLRRGQTITGAAAFKR